MKRYILAVVAIVFIHLEIQACSICGDGFQRRQTLRQRFTDAKIVLFGKLRNPKPGADGLSGTTEFHTTQALKADSKLATPAMIIVPRYYPLIGATPNEYLFFCSIADGKIALESGESATGALVEYLLESLKAGKDALAYFHSHLESKDEGIAADAFLEFAQASDKDIAAMAKRFNRVLLRAWIIDDKVPQERVGVYALMLGLSGTADDAHWLVKVLKESRTERVTANLGGLIAGLIALDPGRGWPILNETLAAKNYSDRFSAIGCLRYEQNTRGKESREAILKSCAILLDDKDLCDIAIDDLRRWAWWDLTPQILKLFQDKSSPLLKRGIVRYALSCPHDDAKSFIRKLRVSDPNLIARVEASSKKK